MLVKKLEDIARIQIGKTPARGTEKYWGKGNLWVSISDLKEKVIVKTKEEITDIAVKECGCKLIPKGNLLLSFKLSIGKIAFAGKDLYTNEAICGITIKDVSEVYPEYLYFALKSARLTGSNAAVMGATLNTSTLNSIKIPLPETLEDQQKIAYILSKAEALIQKRKETLKLLDEFLKSTFLDMFGDPVKNPKGWEKIELGNMGESRLGKMLDSSKQTGENTYPYLGNSNVLWGKFNLENLQTMDFSESERIEFELKEGDLIICEGGEIGRTAIWKNQMQKVYFQKALHRVRINIDKANADYIQYVMWFYAKLTGFKSIIGTATISHLTGVQLKRIKFPVPPLSLQTQFAKIVEKVEGIKQQQEASLKEIENLYHSLMQRGFKGELELGEVEIEKEKSDWNINNIPEKLTDVFQEIKKGSVPFGNSLKEFYDSSIQPQILKGTYISADYVEKLARGLKKGLIENSSVIQELSGNNYSQEQIEQFANSVRIVDTTTDATESNFKLEFDSVETDFEEIGGGFVTEEEAKPVLDELEKETISYLDSLPPIKSKDKNLIKKIRDLDFQQKQAGKIEFDEDYAIYRMLYPKFENGKSIPFAAIFDHLHSFKDMKYDIAKSFIMNELAKKDSKFEQVYDEQMNRVELKLNL